MNELAAVLIAISVAIPAVTYWRARRLHLRICEIEPGFRSQPKGKRID